jgi:hypothetical protein
VKGSRGVLVGPLLRGGALLRWLRGFHVLEPDTLDTLLLLADHMMYPEVTYLDYTQHCLMPRPDALLDNGLLAFQVSENIFRESQLETTGHV